MIQRIQSLYLIAIILLGVVLFCVPVIQFSTPETAEVQRIWYLEAMGLDEVTPNLDTLFVEPVHINGVWGLSLASALIPLLATIVLFLFKRRVLQARLNIFLALLCLGYYGVLAIYIWFAKMNLDIKWNLCFAACIPLICFVLTLGATRRILKDEALVRAADRIR